MDKPKLIVIDDEEDIGEIIKEISWKNGLEFEFESYLKYPDIKKIKDASLYIIDKNLGGEKDGMRLAQELKEAGELGARVMLTGNTNIESQTKAIKNSLFDDWMLKPFGLEIENLMECISNLRENKKIVQKRSIGVYGVGRSGVETIRRAKKIPGVSKVHVFSNFIKGNYSDIESAVGCHNLKNKIKFHNTLESFVESSPDILFVTTGEHGIDFSKPISRKDVFGSSAKKVKPLFENLGKENYEGLVCNFTNPVGPLLQLAKDYGLNPKKLTGISTNMFRTQALLAEYVSCEIGDVKAVSIGEHGEEVIQYNRCLVNGKPLLEVAPKFKNPDTVAKFEKRLKNKGLEDMRSNQHLGFGYEDAPEAISRVLEDILCLQNNARENLYCYFEPGVLEKKGAFLGWDEKISYPSLEIDRALKLSDVNKKTCNIMARQAYEQNKLVENFYNARK